MKVKVSKIKQKLTSVLEAKGFLEEDIPFIVEMYLGGELRGHTTHGLASFTTFIDRDYASLPRPKEILKTNSLYFVDAQSNHGNVIGRQVADGAIAIAKKEALGTAMIKNMDGWLRPGAVAQYIADQGYIAIVLNDGGGTSIAPPGGFDPTLGTNPIAYGIPMEGNSLVVDNASSKKAWGYVRLANKFGTDLPEDTFYDEQGNIASDPNTAYSVKPFGDYKGYSLAMLVEILCGSLVGMEMMVRSTVGNTYGTKFPERGALIVVIDPSQTTTLDEFKKENSELLAKIHDSQKLPEQDIRIPGERAAELQAKRIADDEVELEDSLWEEVQAL